MRRELILVLALLISIIPFDIFTSGENDPGAPLTAATYIVDPQGNGDHTTIQDAVDAASSGDTIRVWNGTYYSSINIYKSLYVIGNGTTASILDGQGTLDHQHLFHVSANGCTIRGFQFKRSSPHHEFGGIGVYTRNNVIEENLFINSNIGIYLASAQNNIVRNNTFKWNIRGIRAEMDSDNNDFIDNLFIDNLNYGFYYERSDNSRITNNTFESNRGSVMLGFHVSNLTISGNLFLNNTNRSALALTYCLDSIIHNNTFIGNMEGVMLAMESHRNSVTWNNITGNGEGVKIYKMYAHLGSCTQNVVHYNRIHNNTVFGLNASWTGGWTTNATNNWWGNDTGPYHPTLNSPGKGDNVSDNVTFIPWLGGEPFNSPPVINDTGPLTAVEDEEFFIRFSAIDPEDDELTWEYVSNVSWLTWNPNNLSVIGTPLNDDVGYGTIAVKVTDPYEAFDELVINFTTLNTAPEIMGYDQATAVEDLLYENDYTSTDDGQGNITWSLTTNCLWLDIDEFNGTIRGMPGNDDVGDCCANITVNDGNGGTASRNITITVRNTNDAPVPLRSELTIEMEEDTVHSLNVSHEFIDPDGDLLEFNVFHQGRILVALHEDGMMDLVPDPNWSGSENFTLYARDMYIEVSMEVNVTVIPVIDAPEDAAIIAPSGPYYENTTYAFSARSSDADEPFGDILTFSWLLLPKGDTFNGTSLELNLTAGNYTLLLNVSDLNGAFSLDMMDLEILKVVVQNDTEPDNNDTELPDDDEEPVPDDDEEPVDDDEEPVDDDDDEEPVDDDTGSGDDNDPVHIMFVIALIAVIACLVLMNSLLLYLYLRKDPWDIEE